MTLACVFPGQGSQKVGMLDAFADRPIVAGLMAEADRALAEPLSALIGQGPAEDLALTVNTQPAMLLAAYACYQAWLDAGGAPAGLLAGHSLGEYTALVVAGSLSLSDAIPLVRLRAQAMQDAVPLGTGTMAAILGLADEAVIEACAQAARDLPHECVEAVNFNAPAQVVIAGHKAAVSLACDLAKAAGAKRAMLLPVSAPFHSSLLRPAGEKLAQALARIELSSPAVPVVNNVDVAICQNPDEIRDALVRQVYNPVRWVEVVQQLKAAGATRIIEFGPGRVLAGLIGRIDNSITISSISDQKSLEAALQEGA